MAVKMANRKKTMMLGLVLVTALMVSTLLVNAEAMRLKRDLGEQKPQTIASKGPVHAVSASIGNAATFRTAPAQTFVIDEDLESDSVDDLNIDAYIEEYEALLEDQRPRKRCVWIVVARGSSWEAEPSTDAVDARVPMGLRFAARPVMDTGDGVLFRVSRGTVGHDGERYRVEGYGWARKENGVFYMKLDGDEIHLKVVGKVYPRDIDTASNARWIRSHRVAMKGKMTVGDDDYLFALRGRAFRVCLRPAEQVFEPSDSV